MKNKTVWVLYAFFAAAALTAAAVTGLNRDLLQKAFLSSTHYIMGALFLCWLYHALCFFRDAPERVKNFFKDEKFSILVTLLITAAVFISSPAYFRVLQDETNLLSVSRSMLNDRAVDNVTQAQYENFSLSDQNYAFPKRPYLYPFAVFILHLLTGYRPVNAFIVNGAAFWGVLLMVYCLMRRKRGHAAAAGTVLLIAAQPIVTQTAGSAGMEMTYIFGAAVCLLTLWHFLKSPGEGNFKFLWLHLLMFAHIRYESPVYLPLILAPLFFAGKIKREYFEKVPSLALTPLFLLPVFWQRFFIETDLELPEGVAPFSPAYLLQHSAEFLKSNLRFDFFLPYSPVIGLCGLAGALFFVWLFVRRRICRQPHERLFTGLAALWLTVHWMILNSHYASFLTEPIGARLWAFMMLVLACSAGWGVSSFFYARGKAAAFVFVSLFVFLVYHPVTIRNYFSNGIVSGREFRIVLKELERFPQRSILVIAEPAGQYVTQKYAALKFERANQEIGSVLGGLVERRYQEIIVVQQWDIRRNQASPETALSPAYKTDPFFELKITPDKTLRLSRVVL